jgi:hypothetical protein
MLYDEWLSSIPLSEYIASREDLFASRNPYQEADEIRGAYPDQNRVVIMRREATKWELFLKEGRAAMRQTCASPWGDHLVRCAEYMYGMPPEGWKITKTGKRKRSVERRVDRAGIAEQGQEENGAGERLDPPED